MARRKSTGGGVLLVGLLAIVAFIVNFVAENWRELLWVAGLGAVIWIGYLLATRSRRAAPEPADLELKVSVEPVYRRHRSREAQYREPTPRPTTRDAQSLWVPRHQSGTVHGLRLGGMLYVGSGLYSVGEQTVEPALIDPTLPATTSPIPLEVRRLDYWPSYVEASKDARGAYLQWLASGRGGGADVGYVFLYFYGLERRALFDARTVPQARTELPAIQEEIERLMSLYPDSRPLQRYGQAFLDMLTVSTMSDALYREPPPRSDELTLRHRLALAQCAGAGAPLPADWALAWLEADPGTRLPLPARRCHDEFSRLFALRYRELFGGGIVLPKNKTRFRLDYRPASATFRGWSQPLGVSLDLPDVSVLSSPLRKLREVAEACAEELARYSRRAAKGPVSPNAFESLVDLPFDLWPGSYRQHFEKVSNVVRLSDRPLSVPFETVRSWLPPMETLGKVVWREFVERLAEAEIGVEPDPTIGGKVPELDSKVVFFPLAGGARDASASASYRAAAMTLHLASAVAGADGGILDAERSSLVGRLEDWLHLTEVERQRLHAHLRRLLDAPPKLKGLKRQVAALDQPARESIGAFVVTIAQADGTVSRVERRMLERIFALLALDESRLPPARAATGPTTVMTAPEAAPGYKLPSRPGGFKIDPARVATLQAETERVSALLGQIFTDEKDDSEPVPVEEAPEAEPAAPGIWGLDPPHAEFVNVLMERSEWSRAELEELADDRSLMLDGVLEHINEACLDATGQPFVEGDDPMVVHRDAVHQAEAA